MKFKKEFGQNFLIDEVYISTLVDNAQVTSNDIVLEIGPGVGYVSKDIAKRAKKLFAVEIDTDLIPQLKQALRSFNNVEIINADGLSFFNDLSRINDKGINKLVSSLPFQITSPILHQAVVLKDDIPLSTLLIQKEVAERITEEPPQANYMSIYLKTFFDIKIITFVDKLAFDPVPSVNGAIIKLEAIKEPLISKEEIHKYSKYLHHGFMQQRKMLNKRFDKKVLEEVEIDPSRRAETLTISEWVKLFNVTRKQNEAGNQKV